MTKNIISENLDQPEILEESYQSAPDKFRVQFREAFEQNKKSETLRVWNARLHHQFAGPQTPRKKSVTVFVLVALCLITGVIAKLPAFFPVSGEWYYPRFMPLITTGAVMGYFFLARPCQAIGKVVLSGVVLNGLYAGLLPDNSDSSSITMALVHLPFISITLLAISFMSDGWKDVEPRIQFIRYIGEIGIYSILILSGGMVLTGITLGLFSLIKLSIEQWYIKYIVVLGLVCTPLVATYLFDAVLNRQSRLAIILSNVFSPLFLVTVLAYLIATIYQGKTPYNDRDFLIIFNGLLLVILAITIFSVSGRSKTGRAQITDFINITLISATLVVNIVALSATVLRWLEYGITVNRVVVTGANILIFIHLALLLGQYIKNICFAEKEGALEAAIAKYLPVYAAWSVIVAVVLPVVFLYR